MSDEKEPFLDRLKTMPLEEVVVYETAAITVSRIINVIGILCALFMFLFPIVGVLFSCGCLMAYLAYMSTGIDDSLNEIRSRIEKLDKSR